MKDVGDRALMIGAILVGLIIAVIVWFVAISPQLASAQEAKDATAAQIAQNADLTKTLAERKLIAEKVPDYKREIYAIRDILPQIEDLPALRRTLDEITSSLGLTIDVEDVSDPEPIIGGLSLLAPMAQVGLTSEIEETLFSTLQVTTFEIEIVGTLTEISDLIEALQSRESPFILVTRFVFTESGDESESLVRAKIQAAIFTLDEGVRDIHDRLDERPWPGTTEETLVPSSEPAEVIVPAPAPSASPSPSAEG